MIIDRIENTHLYYGLSERIKTALKYLESFNINKFKPGRYEVDGSAVFALFQEYVTNPIESGIWEAHRRYIDIQFIAEGTELMGYSNIKSMKISKPYDADKDMLNLEGDGHFLTMNKGTFIILMPHDVHMPCCYHEVPGTVKKIVMKVLAT
jgi:YhcH/YjgK/YiaL family protein